MRRNTLRYCALHGLLLPLLAHLISFGRNIINVARTAFIRSL
jgi:hypothetical protein